MFHLYDGGRDLHAHAQGKPLLDELMNSDSSFSGFVSKYHVYTGRFQMLAKSLKRNVHDVFSGFKAIGSFQYAILLDTEPSYVLSFLQMPWGQIGTSPPATTLVTWHEFNVHMLSKIQLKIHWKGHEWSTCRQQDACEFAFYQRHIGRIYFDVSGNSKLHTEINIFHGISWLYTYMGKVRIFIVANRGGNKDFCLC